MILEKGDYFCITRGCRLGGFPFFAENPANAIAQVESYDRSYNGMVFLAESVEPEIVVARVVFASNSINNDKLNKVMILHLSEIKVWRLSQESLEALKIKE